MIPEIQELKDKNKRYSSFSQFRSAIANAGFPIIRDSNSNGRDSGGNEYVDIDNPYGSSADGGQCTTYVRITCRKGHRSNDSDTGGYYIGNLISGGYGLKSTPTGTSAVPLGEWFEASGKGDFTYPIGPSADPKDFPRVRIKLRIANANHRTLCIHIFITRQVPGSPEVKITSIANGAECASGHKLYSTGIIYPKSSACPGCVINPATCSCDCHDDPLWPSSRPNLTKAFLSCFNAGRTNDGYTTDYGEDFDYSEPNPAEGTIYGINAVAEIDHMPQIMRIRLDSIEGIGVGKVWSIDYNNPIENWVDNSSVISNPE